MIQTKTVYRYDEKTLFYLYPDIAYESPLEPGKFLIPPYCTEQQPLPPKEGYNVRFTDDFWIYTKIPTPPQPPEPTLDELKEQKIYELKSERNLRENENLNYNDKLIDYDVASREKLEMTSKALQLTDPTSKVDWTLADNTSTKFGVVDFNNILIIGVTRCNQIHVKYRDLVNKVKNCKTKEEVKEIKWE